MTPESLSKETQEFCDVGACLNWHDPGSVPEGWAVILNAGEGPGTYLCPEHAARVRIMIDLMARERNLAPGQCPKRHPEHGDECHKLTELIHTEHHNVATGRKWSNP